ncbi:MAG: hydrogenase maturation protease [Microcoleaceae cyanobacterium MO_207.B10]|nr:hydrogenase maturation protease [Microcoleaceae cyanobacterium MO_207.B10]
MTEILIIGYGNTLRSDDGAGQRVAELVAEWNLPNVRSLPVHQLTPELAEPISQAELVIFVDAYPATSEQGLQVHQLCDDIPYSSPKSQSLAHAVDPRSLLSLSQILYNNVPPAWWILVPAVNFEFGESFSEKTTENIQYSLAQIKQIFIK